MVVATLLSCIMAHVCPDVGRTWSDYLFTGAIISWLGVGLGIILSDTWGTRGDWGGNTGAMFTLYLFSVVGLSEAYLLLPWATALIQVEKIVPSEEREGSRLAENDQAGAGVVMVSMIEVEDARPSSAAKGKSRMFFLDNLKVALTVLVVLHHCICTSGAGCFLFTFVTVDPTAMACYRECVQVFPGDPFEPCTGPFCDGAPIIGVARAGCFRTIGTSAAAALPACAGNSTFSELVMTSYFNKAFGPWLLDLNQAYFMGLFFFISAYFTPTSCDRKGLYGFIADKVKRLGLPVLGWWFALGPLWLLLILSFMGATSHFEYKPTVGGPTWFIAWLLAMNLLYAFMRGEPLILPRPQMTTLFAVALFVGIIMGNFGSGMWYQPDFMNMPGGLYSAVWYAIFFGAGIVAKRGKWLESLGSTPKTQVYFCYAFAVLLALSLLYYHTAMAYWSSPATPDYSRATAALFKGVMPMAIILAQLFAFQRVANFSGNVSKFLAEAAYTVYLIHTHVVVATSFCFCKILEAAGVEAHSYFNGSSFGYLLATENQEAVAWGGWLFTVVLSELVVWPLAWGVAKLPLVDRVLGSKESKPRARPAPAPEAEGREHTAADPQ